MFKLDYIQPKTSYDTAWETGNGAAPNLSNTADIADWFGVSVRKIQDWRAKGKGPKYEVWGSKAIYRPEYIVAYLGDIYDYLCTGKADGLAPIAGTKLEHTVRGWIEAQGRNVSDFCLKPKSRNRTREALIINKKLVGSILVVEDQLSK
ncbi:helix-turn-helix domain-containing protein [Sphingomonas carotinifaciens]|uniref:helix-turn-helix domain-containing protein n=1 Tax=Sphingomonas carotinifaciens TaxID=1166323 RepID=UPI0012375BB3|nr:helix-turn-helix domain-containing protein [Sphingomonas carotinifaciens]